jgi:UDP-N-acetylmuramoyl-tripeptide--D-alanyl-D-alanine ligase
VLGVPGRHAVTGALLALAVAELHSVARAAAAEAVSAVEPTGMRGERRLIGGLTALVDCYNANPQSVGAALATLAEGAAPGGRVAVLGSMLELGPESPEWHRQVLAQALTLPLELVVAVGLFAEAARGMGGTGAGGAALLAAETPEEAAELLGQRLSGGETVLLKGSRGVALERIIPLLESSFGDTGRTAAGGG